MVSLYGPPGGKGSQPPSCKSCSVALIFEAVAAPPQNGEAAIFLFNDLFSDFFLLDASQLNPPLPVGPLPLFLQAERCLETHPSFSASPPGFAQSDRPKTRKLLDILKCPHTDPAPERFRPRPETGVQLLFGYFLLAMKIAIISFTTEVAARLKIVWTLLCYSHVQGTPMFTIHKRWHILCRQCNLWNPARIPPFTWQWWLHIHPYHPRRLA